MHTGIEKVYEIDRQLVTSKETERMRSIERDRQRTRKETIKRKRVTEKYAKAKKETDREIARECFFFLIIYDQRSTFGLKDDCIFRNGQFRMNNSYSRHKMTLIASKESLSPEIRIKPQLR